MLSLKYSHECHKDIFNHNGQTISVGMYQLTKAQITSVPEHKHFKYFNNVSVFQDTIEKKITCIEKIKNFLRITEDWYCLKISSYFFIPIVYNSIWTIIMNFFYAYALILSCTQKYLLHMWVI